MVSFIFVGWKLEISTYGSESGEIMPIRQSDADPTGTRTTTLSVTTEIDIVSPN